MRLIDANQAAREGVNIQTATFCFVSVFTLGTAYALVQNCHLFRYYMLAKRDKLRTLTRKGEDNGQYHDLARRAG
ncbi:hypothetical protein BN439_0443 [Erwinia amylovora Ea644]|nr:hypothetical protein BN439_0443 [Erwinia amylovora Ea644]